MKNILAVTWFYSRLSFVVGWNCLTLGLQLHFSTRSFLSMFGLFIGIAILFVFKLLSWQTGYFSTTNYTVSSETQRALHSSGLIFNEVICTDSSYEALMEKLAQLLEEQPTHRDVLLNTILASNNSLIATNAAIIQTARYLDPNHPLIQQLP